MKKFTALLLVVLMVVVLVPFGAFADTTWTEVKTAEQFAAMKDGNYWLTADIDLSKATWTTIAEFTGTLNGNGHTVTVPADAPIFDNLKGTVKNVNLKGTCTLDVGDKGSYVAANTFANAGVGVLANYACGATVTNVKSEAKVSYNGDHANFGGLFGNASAASAEKKTVITNCVVGGELNYKTSGSGEVPTGGLIGFACGGVEVYNTEVCVKGTFAGGAQDTGAFVGYALFNGTGSEYAPTLFENCLFSGELNVNNANRVAFAGQAKGITIKNCFMNGTITSSGNVAHFAGWGNVGNQTPNNQTNTIEGSASVATLNGGGKHFSRIKTGNAFVKNCILLADQPIGDGPVQAGNVTKESAAELTTEFVTRNANTFKVVNGKVTLVQPTFTPEANPFGTTEGGNQGGNEGNIPTGDATIVLVAVALVSLAAVTVIAKKRITE